MKRKESSGNARIRRPGGRLQLADALVDICQRISAVGFVAATDGNVSVRLPGGNILITRSGIAKGLVTRNDLVEVTSGGMPVTKNGRPSTEAGMHLYVFNSRPDVGAVIHAHPPFATAFAAARRGIEAPVFPEVIVGLGPVPLARYATPSTPAVADALAPFVSWMKAVLLANHGVVTCGSDLQEAWRAMEKLEHTARTLTIATVLGGAIPLTVEELEQLRAVSVKSYGVSLDAQLSRFLKHTNSSND